MTGMNEETVTIDSDLKELIPRYLLRRIEDANKIRLDVEQLNFESIRILGHTLKGSGYGFQTINEIGKILEKAADKKDTQKILEIANQLEHYVETVTIVYKS